MSSRRRTGRRPPPLSVARPGYAAATSGDPFAGVEHVYIDGSNLMHALARGAAVGGSAGPGAGLAPAGAVIGRIRAAFPPSVVVDLVFDGPAVGGIKGRLATGLRVAYSGRFTADKVIDDAIAGQLEADGPAATWRILVITDDRMLRESVTRKGARCAGTAWLGGRMGRMAGDAPGPAASSPASRSRGASRPAVCLPKAGTTIGHRRPPRAPAPDRD
jgi:hypothetical protein